MADATSRDGPGVGAADSGPGVACPVVANNPASAASSSAGTPAVASCPLDLTRALAGVPSFTFAVDPTVATIPTTAPFQRCGALGEVARDITLSPDGRRIALLAAETVRLFGTDPWREIAHLAHGVEPIDGVAFSPDGTRLATLSSHAGQVALWNADTGALVRIYPGAKSTDQFLSGGALAFSADGGRLATALSTIINLESGSTVTIADGRLRGGQNSGLWFTNGDATLLARTLYRSGDSWAGTLIERFATSDGHAEDSVGDNGALSADLTMAAGVAHGSGMLTVESIGTPVPGVALRVPTDLLLPLGLGSDAGPVALTNRAEGLVLETDGAFIVVPAQDPDRIIARIPKTPGMRLVAISPRDEIVTSGACGTIGWSWHTGAALWSQPFNVDRVTWSADGATAVALGPDALFRALRGDTLAVLCAPPGGQRAQTIVSSDDGQTVVVQYDDGQLDLRAGDLSLRAAPLLPGEAAPGIPVAVSDDAGVLLTIADLYGQAPLTVWSLADGRPIASFNEQLDSRFALSPDGTRLAHGGSTGIAIVDLAGGTPALSIEAREGELVAFSTDGARVALASANGFAIFDAGDGSRVATFAPSSSAGGYGLALSHDWSVAVGVSSSSTNPQAVSWRPPDGLGRSFAVSNDGDSMLSSDGGILATNQIIGFVELAGEFLSTTLWDVASGSVLQQFEDHPVRLLRGGRHLIGADGALFCRPPPAVPGH